MAKAKVLKGQLPMFEPMKAENGWKASENLPDLSSHDDIWLDCETTGNNKRKDVPVGFALALRDSKGMYIPFGHEEGGNIDPDKVKDWARRELRGKRIRNVNTGFDAETIRNWGVDLEEQGCMLHDVAHTAALLDENRYGNEFTLDHLGKEYVGRGKVDPGISPENFHKSHASNVAAYAVNDAELARDVDLAQRPLVAEQSLERVEALEDELIWPNNHMERNGMRLDMPKLGAWREGITQEYSDLLMDIYMKTFIKMRPNINTDWGQLMDACGLGRNKTGERKPAGKKCLLEFVDVESYTDDFLRKIEHPLVQAALRMRRLSSLKSKYIDKYWKAQKEGVLYFNLYQLRATEEDYGTVVGRYSSANVNIQQVFKVENQIRRFGEGYVIRELMIPDDGYDMFSVDGSQLQFRLFAHYSRDPDLIGAYQRDLHLKPGEKPIDFHQMVSVMFDLDRQAAKHNNFAMVLGMGNEKLAQRLGKACTCRDSSWWSKYARAYLSREESREHIFGLNENHAEGCPAREANDLATKYNERFPAAKKTMQLVSKTAENRGYIHTILGRRRRFVDNDKYYSAFASLLQGSEADVVKTKINTVYKERKTIGVHKLRCPVHDELVGDIEKDEKYKRLFEECCAQQELDLKVPIVWNPGYGANWMKCK